MQHKIEQAQKIADEFKELVKSQNFKQAVITALDLAIIAKELRDGKR